MTYRGYLRLVIAIIHQAIRDARNPQIWDDDSWRRPALRSQLQKEAIDWLLNSEMIETASLAWNLSREELIQRIATYTKER